MSEPSPPVNGRPIDTGTDQLLCHFEDGGGNYRDTMWLACENDGPRAPRARYSPLSEECARSDVRCASS